MVSSTHLKFDQESRVVFISPIGKLKSDGIRRQIAQALDHPEFRSGMNIIVDMRAVEFSGINYCDFLPFSTEWRQLNDRLGRCKIAYVRGNKLQFALARFLVDSFLQGGVEKRSFFDIPSAAEWLRFPRDSWHFFKDQTTAEPVRP